MKYAINVQGCDDNTEVVMELTPDEWDIIARLTALINATSTYGCMPTMSLREADLDEEETHEEKVSK